MKALSSVLLAASLCCGLCATGCVTSHSESDKPGWFGGHKHEETTTTQNPVTGETSTTHKEQKTTVNPITGDTSTTSKEQKTGN